MPRERALLMHPMSCHRGHQERAEKDKEEDMPLLREGREEKPHDVGDTEGRKEQQRLILTDILISSLGALRPKGDITQKRLNSELFFFP